MRVQHMVDGRTGTTLNEEPFTHLGQVLWAIEWDDNHRGFAAYDDLKVIE